LHLEIGGMGAGMERSVLQGRKARVASPLKGRHMARFCGSAASLDLSVLF
jgi:hypothetical protein